MRGGCRSGGKACGGAGVALETGPPHTPLRGTPPGHPGSPSPALQSVLPSMSPLLQPRGLSAAASQPPSAAAPGPFPPKPPPSPAVSPSHPAVLPSRDFSGRLVLTALPAVAGPLQWKSPPTHSSPTMAFCRGDPRELAAVGLPSRPAAVLPRDRQRGCFS